MGDFSNHWLLSAQKITLNICMTNITIPQQAVDLIKNFEGLKLSSYQCPAKIWTIGYGTTRIKGKAVAAGQRCTKEQAEEYLRDDLQVFAQAVKQLVKVPLNDNQFSALLSFTYNLGVGAFEKSTLLRRLNEGNYTAARNEFFKWVNAGGKQLPGLVKRRAAEAELFMK